MKRSSWFLFLCVGAIVGCSQPTTMPQIQPESLVRRPHSSPVYRSIYSFEGGTDGYYPNGELTAVDGVLFGTTAWGGGKDGNGTVFKVNSSGTETVLYRFRGPRDGPGGAIPATGLTWLDGALYGTTEFGGTNCRKVHGCGTVFKITTSGREQVIYSFRSTDGSNPGANLTAFGGALYGTTYCGGVHDSRTFYTCYFGGGTVFEVSTTGAEQVLNRFRSPQGLNPGTKLMEVSGQLYGATIQGGNNSGCGTPVTSGCGTIFKIGTTGGFTVLSDFGKTTAGNPAGGLTLLNGALYGTTFKGGSNGYGTVFKITKPAGVKIIYSFKGGTDGIGPQGDMVALNGELYGTTVTGAGGACHTRYGGSRTPGCGAIFEVSPLGQESVVYTFKGGPHADGDGPDGLIAVNGTLYGTTSQGGSHKLGTVFMLTP
jgi:uncharacterized repeat protein (TIGR03803 family)